MQTVDTRFVPVAATDDWERLRERSTREPVVLFKHDPPCSISLIALRELSRLGGEIPTIDVARSHGLSMAVARQTEVRHESPQVIVLRDSRAVWSASHFAITADAVAEALAAATEEQAPAEV